MQTQITPDVAFMVILIPAGVLILCALCTELVANHIGWSAFDRSRTVRVLDAQTVIVTRVPMLSRKAYISEYRRSPWPGGPGWYRLPAWELAESAVVAHIERAVAQWRAESWAP